MEHCFHFESERRVREPLRTKVRSIEMHGEGNKQAPAI